MVCLLSQTSKCWSRLLCPCWMSCLRTGTSAFKGELFSKNSKARRSSSIVFMYSCKCRNCKLSQGNRGRMDKRREEREHNTRNCFGKIHNLNIGLLSRSFSYWSTKTLCNIVHWYNGIEFFQNECYVLLSFLQRTRLFIDGCDSLF